MTSFNTIERTSEGIYKEKGSKFMAYLFPVETEDRVKAILEDVRSEHPKSRHVCYAFRLGKEGELERTGDAGEPNGSAGLPILNTIHSADLTNVLLVVVRYFGGTKLGLSGLANAYKEAARDAVANSLPVKFVPMLTIHVGFPLAEIGKVERFINSEKLTVTEKQFGDLCSFSIKVEEEKVSKVKDSLSQLHCTIN